jgi:type IV secretion system protein VirB10
MSRMERSIPEESGEDPSEGKRGETSETETPASGIEGDRGIASVNQPLSLQLRLSNVLAIGLMLVLGLGFLTWYYTQAFARQAKARQAAQSAVRERAQVEMALPPLGRVDPPESSMAEAFMGPPPPLPRAATAGFHRGAENPYATASGAALEGGANPARSMDRRLAGPVFSNSSERPMSAAAPAAGESEEGGAGDPGSSEVRPSMGSSAGAAREIGGWLHPTVTVAARARVLPTQEMLLPKGAFIDCTLETAIDSSLPGLTTCVTATDTFGADGKVVLLERGTKLVGETRGEVQQGMARLFVLWTEARTPTGVVVPLASPGTDELGRSGLPGEVNRHFLQRFGAAILVSVIDGAVQSAVQSGHQAGAVLYNPSASQEVLTGILKNTISIPPTVVKRNGDRIQILVARDLDFRTVYELRSLAPHE